MTCKHVLKVEVNGSAYLHHGVAGPWVCPWCEVDTLKALVAEMYGELETVEYDRDPPDRVLSMLERARASLPTEESPT